MKIFGIKKTKAYEIIRKLNKMLEKEGYLTIAGRVSADFADRKLALTYKGE